MSSGSYSRMDREARSLVYASDNLDEVLEELRTSDSIDQRVAIRVALRDAHLSGSSREPDLETAINVLRERLAGLLTKP